MLRMSEQDDLREPTAAEERLEHTTEELDDRLHRLEDELHHAEELAAEHRRAAVGGEDVAGDWEDTEPSPMGGDDPEGAEHRS
jgi:hypothetical protein